MIIFLLIIIAIGVLLLSEEGKALLNGLSKLAIIAGILFLVFWAVVLGIVFFSDKEHREWLSSIFGVGILIILIVSLVNYLKELWKDRTNVAHQVKSLPKKIWKEHKVAVVVFAIVYASFMGVIIWALAQPGG